MSYVKILQLLTFLVSQEHWHSNLYGVSTIEKRIKWRINELQLFYCTPCVNIGNTTKLRVKYALILHKYS